MREKLLDLMKNEGLKPSQLAEMLEINPAGVSHILAGRNKPGFDLLQKILRRFPRINPDWLLLDSDKMYRETAMPVTAIGSSGNSGSSDTTVTPRSVPQSGGLFDTPRPLASPAVPGEKSNTANSAIPVPRTGSANVARIVVLYEDQTFDTYMPTR